MPTSSGRWFALRQLHFLHAITTLSQRSAAPPRDIGTMWSTVSSAAGADEAAVLAGVVVAQQQVAPVGSEQPSRHVDGAQQADDHDALGQAPPGERLRGLQLGALVDECDPLLGQQDDQSPVTDHIERLHARR